MFNCRLLICFVVFALPTPADADDELLRQIRHEFNDQLVPLDRLLPGYERPSEMAPTLAVGDFVPQREEDRAWSFIIGEVMRWRIQYVPTIKLRMPSAYDTAIDSGVDRSSREPILGTPDLFRTINQSLGMENILTGRLDRKGDGDFLISASIVDAVSGDVHASREWRTSEDALPEALIGITTWVYDSLDVGLSDTERAFVEDRSTIPAAALLDFKEQIFHLYDAPLIVRREIFTQLRDDHPAYAPFAVYLLYAQDYPSSLQDVRDNLKRSADTKAAFPGHDGVELESYRAMDTTSVEDYDVEKRVNGLRALVERNPQDPMVLMNYAYAYADSGRLFEGISIMLELVERWPDNYRGWWSLGDLINRHAFDVRGTKFWSEVPRWAQERFKSVSFMGAACIDKGIEMQPRNGGIWVAKLNVMGAKGGYSREFMAAFEEAASLAPTNQDIYANALNYSLNQWGGNAAARRHIIELAEENNPDAAWPKMMRTHHAADFTGIQGVTDGIADELELRGLLMHEDLWKIVLGILGFIATVYVYYQSHRTQPAGVDEDFEDDEDWHDPIPPRRELTPSEKLEEVQRRNR